MGLNFNIFKKGVKEAVQRSKDTRGVIEEEEKLRKAEAEKKEREERAAAEKERADQEEEVAAMILTKAVDSIAQHVAFNHGNEPLCVMKSIPASDIVMYYPHIEGISEGDLQGSTKIVFEFLKKNGNEPYLEWKRQHRSPCIHSMWIRKVETS